MFNAGDLAAAQAQASAALTAADRRTLSKLVGCLTKAGKKSKAQNILLEAMHIVKAQLAAQQGGGKK
jgi:ribosomal protein S7